MAEIKTQTLGNYLRLIEISRDLASTLDLDILLDDIIGAAADITHAEAASILLYDDMARQLYFQVATNIDEPTMRGIVVPLDSSIAGWIVTNRQSVRIEDAHEDARFFNNVEQTVGYSTKSLLGLPLITKNKVVGVLEVINKKKGEIHRFRRVDPRRFRRAGGNRHRKRASLSAIRFDSRVRARTAHAARLARRRHLFIAASGNVARTARSDRE